MNKKIELFEKERNNRVHRTTGKRPAEALQEEKLMSLPQIDSKPYRLVQAVVSKTGFVEFETNRYSVPSQYSEMAAELLGRGDRFFHAQDLDPRCGQQGRRGQVNLGGMTRLSAKFEKAKSDAATGKTIKRWSGWRSAQPKTNFLDPRHSGRISGYNAYYRRPARLNF